MKKLFLIPIAVITLFILTQYAYAYDAGSVASQIQSFSGEITADSGDIDQVLADAFDADPRLVLYYGGYSGSRSTEACTINLNYSNTDTPLTDIYYVETIDELKTLLTRAIVYSESRLCVVTKDLPLSSSVLNSYILNISDTCPIGFMGYRGNSISSLDAELGGYYSYIIDFQYDFDKDTLLQMKETLENKACQIVASYTSRDMPAYMKVLIIHDYIIDHCSYATGSDAETNPIYFTAYGALVNGTAVCDGYASAAEILFSLCGIENQKVMGTSNGTGHAWNMVKIDNEYYHIDVTWDDPVSSSGIQYLIYDYFNLTDSEISADHAWDKSLYHAANGTSCSYDNTMKYVKSDDTQYVEGYGSFISIFGTYAPLTGSTNPNSNIVQCDVTSTKVIDPGVTLLSGNYKPSMLSRTANTIISLYESSKIYVAAFAFVIAIVVFLKLRKYK